MRRNIKTTEGIFPMPVLMIATYNEDGSVDVMNAAWGTMLSRNQVILNLTETHKTVKNIKRTGYCTVSLGTKAHVAECDYLGIVSAKICSISSLFTILPTSFVLSATFLPVSVAIRIQAFLDKIPNFDVKFVTPKPKADAIKNPL